MITIRTLAAADASRFKSIRVLAASIAPTAILPTRAEEERRSIEDFSARIECTPTQTVFGAFDADTLVGIAGVRREALAQASHKATIWGVFVDPSQRGKGLARALLNAATAHASQTWNCAQLILCVNAENIPAKQLYLSMGFTTFGVEPRAMQVDGRFYDEEHMIKKLS
jgi:ribosomal protein S18 acetylase RimI-like enzyme